MPDARRRSVDFLRAVAIAVVVLGHWLAVVLEVRNGTVSGTNLIALAPTAQLLTWAVQVLPVFFLVGGFANAASWSGAQARGETWLAWTTSRMYRLLMPATLLIATGVAISAAARAAGAPPGVVRIAAGLAGFLLWFLTVYVAVVALAPAAVAAHRRWGLWVPAALAAATAAVDIARLVWGAPGVGWLNFLLVWGGLAQLGIAWRLGTLEGPPRPAVLAGGGLLAAVALVALPAYPLSMVTVPGSTASNANPPSLALFAFGAAQAGLAILLSDRLERLCRRPRVWLATVVVNRFILPLYLWHLVPVVLAAALMLAGFFPSAPALSAQWWALRPAWLVLLLALLVPLLYGVTRAERLLPGPPPTAPAGRVRTVLGIVAVTLVCSGLARLTLGGLSTTEGIGIPTMGLILFGGGLTLLTAAAGAGVARRPP